MNYQIEKPMTLFQKLEILADAAKYDVACTSSGVDRRNDGQGDVYKRQDLTVALAEKQDAEKETVFENCVADVNIPVGEVFTLSLIHI